MGLILTVCFLLWSYALPLRFNVKESLAQLCIRMDQDLELDCSTDEQVELSLWMKDKDSDSPFILLTPGTYTERNQILTIKSHLVPDVSAEFLCRATGSDRSTVSLKYTVNKDPTSSIDNHLYIQLRGHTDSNQTVHVYDGQRNVTLTCEMEMHCSAVQGLEWFVNGIRSDTVVSYTYVRHFVPFSAVDLTLDSVSMKDHNSTLACTKQSGGNSTATVSVRLMVHSKEPKRPDVFLGEFKRPFLGFMVDVECTVDAFPLADITIRMGDLVLADCANSIVCVYRIAHLQAADAGWYSCEARNIFGEASVETEMRPMVLPSLDGRSYEIWSDNTHDVEVRCSVLPGTHHPIGVMTLLMHSSAECNSSDCEVKEVASSNFSRELRCIPPIKILAGLHRPSRYTCAYSILEERSNLDIFVKLPPPKSPFLSTSTRELFLEPGKDALVECRASSFLNISWLLGSSVMNSSVCDESVVPCTLQVKIVNASTFIEDFLRCRAEDKHGFMAEVQVRVTVSRFRQPTIKLMENVTIGPRSAETTLLLNCIADGVPTPTIEWLHEGQPLQPRSWEPPWAPPSSFCLHNSTDTISQGGKLVVCHMSTERAGRYTCVAGNSQGRAVSSAYVSVHGPPVIHTCNRMSLPDKVACVVRGTPVPAVEWTRQDGVLVVYNLNITGDNVEAVMNGPLDTTVFRCFAQNDLGSATCTYIVSPSPKESNKTPRGGGRALNSTELGLTVAAPLLVVVVSCFLFMRWQRERKNQMSNFNTKDMLMQLNGNVEAHEIVLRNPYDPIWEFPRDRIVLRSKIGNGAFGEVFLADAIGIAQFRPRKRSDSSVHINRSNSSTTDASVKVRLVSFKRQELSDNSVQVAVKMLKPNATTDEHRDLLSELKVLVHVGEHRNIVNLLGACTRNGPLMVLLEYCEFGNMNAFLRDHRDVFFEQWDTSFADKKQILTFVDLLSFSYQISKGMEFLASRMCIHRDLAARNILLTADLTVKIADFGLARKTDYYHKHTSGLLPIKWMAIESILDRVFTTKSDVWSFGVVMWETFTLGGSPYPGLGVDDLLVYLKSGMRMECPSHCPSKIYDIVQACWKEIPEDRPNFSTLSRMIADVMHIFVENDSPYISVFSDQSDETTQLVG